MPTDEPDPNAAAVVPFTETLASINKGAVSGKAALQLAELVRLVQATGRKGSLKLTITVKPFKGNDRTVEVAADSTVTNPVPDPHAGVFYVDDKGGLFRNDPLQPSLDLGLVDTPRPGAERPIA